MPHAITRRRALAALGGLGALVLGRPLRALPRRALCARPDAIAELAGVLRAASREAAFDRAADAIRAGTSVETVLGAVLRIGVLDVRPRPHGILHTVMMVRSTFALTDGAEPQEAWLAVLWNLDDLKTAQERDREDDGDWSMPPRPDARAASPQAARAELHAALDARDGERADRAVVAFLARADRAALFETLRPHAVGCAAFIAHKAILAAQLERALARLPESEVEPCARSLVRALAVGRDESTWGASVERAARLAPAAEADARGGARVLALHAALRAAQSDEAAALVAEALAEGATRADAWCALRLGAAELFHRRTGRRGRDGRAALLPVHGPTVVEALGHAARTTSDARIADACLLEAAARLPALRAFLEGAVGLQPVGPPLVELGRDVEPPAELVDALATGSPAVLRAHLAARPASQDRVGARLRASLLRTACEHHQTKYLVAALDEAARSPAELRPALLAPAVDYVAHPEDEPTEVHERSLRALARAGLR